MAHTAAGAVVISLARWRAACAELGVAEGEREHAKVLRAWRGFGRRYHNTDHLVACLQELDGARFLATHPAEVELALWFHDAIYRTWRRDNEGRSARWAARFLSAHGATSAVSERVKQLVLVTAHAAGDLAGDAALVVDIDLSILGQPADVYDGFERAIRKEYWWVRQPRFAAGRTAILQSFLTRPAIYHFREFRERYEDTARENLRRAIRQLTPQGAKGCV